MNEPTPSPADEAFQARVAAAAEAALGPVTVTGLERLSGGHSGLTWIATLCASSGDRQQVVIKSAPPGRPAVGRHDVLRQAGILKAVAELPGVAVPRVVFADSSDPPFFAGELLRGETVEPIFETGEASGSVLVGRFETAARMLAALHGSVPEAARAEGGRARSPLDELEHWAPVMGAGEITDRAGAARLEAALRNSAPKTGRAAIVHGDFRLGNIVFDGPAAAGIIDWEIWSLADPRVDLAWYVIFTEPETFPSFSSESELPSSGTLVSAYADASVDRPADLDWFHALASFKMAGIFGHNLKRHRTSRYPDPEQERLAPTIDRLIERGLAYLG